MATQSYVTFNVNGINVFYQTGQVPSSTLPSSTILTNIFAAYNCENVNTTLDTSIYAVYNGENNTNDQKGTNHGTAGGSLTYSTGKVGNAFQFNGTNAYIQLPNNSLNLTGDFSISFWYYTTVIGVEKSIISNYNSSTANGNINGTGFNVITLTNNTIGIYIYNNGYTTSFSTATLAANTWYHVSITRKSGTRTRVYVNGSLSRETLSAIDPVYNPVTFTPTIGRSAGGFYVNGKMDSINFWNKELTDEEALNLYNVGNGAEYPFTGQTLASKNDLVGTNHGTFVNGATITTGKIGNSFTFDGVNDFVALTDNSLNFSGDFTVSGWVYVSNSGPQAILENSYYRTTPSYNYSGWGIFIDVSGTSTRKLGFIIPRGTTNSYLGWQFETTQLTLNAWNHIIVTRVAGVNTYAWINNIAQSYIALGPAPSSSINIDPVYTSTQKCTIGASNGGTSPGNFMRANSKIDALTIWNRQLTADERTYIYNSGNGIQHPFT